MRTGSAEPIRAGTGWALARACVIPGAAVGLVVSALCVIWGSGAALSAAAGSGLALIAVLAGPVLLMIGRSWSPPALMAGALIGYLITVVLIGAIYLWLTAFSWLSGAHAAVALGVVTSAALAGQIRATPRLRILVFGADTDGDHPLDR